MISGACIPLLLLLLRLRRRRLLLRLRRLLLLWFVREVVEVASDIAL